MKINVEKVGKWEPQGSRNGPQNHLKIDEKTYLVTASAAKAPFSAPGSMWGYPPCRKRLHKHLPSVPKTSTTTQRKKVSENKAILTIYTRIFTFVFYPDLVRARAVLFSHCKCHTLSILCSMECCLGITSCDDHPFTDTNTSCVSARVRLQVHV